MSVQVEANPYVERAFAQADSAQKRSLEAENRATTAGKNPGMTHAVIKACAEADGMMRMLAVVLDVAGLDVRGHGGLPSVERAHVLLIEWQNARKQ